MFPEKLELVVGGVPRGTWDANTVNNSAFQAMQVRYEPAFNKLQMGANTVQVEQRPGQGPERADGRHHAGVHVPVGNG